MSFFQRKIKKNSKNVLTSQIGKNLICICLEISVEKTFGVILKKNKKNEIGHDCLN
jgi:hypothetical protein